VPNLYQDNCRYTPLTTATQTINPGQAGQESGLQGVSGNLPTTFSVFYGVNVTNGTGATISAYDVIPPTGVGTNTGTTTNLLAVGTLTGPGFVSPSGAIGYPGVRYYGALVVEGGAGSGNCLWD
jgi:hypothetical protein